MGWWTDPELLTPELEATFGSLDGVMALPQGLVSTSARTDLLRVEIDGGGYYVKRYQSRGSRPERILFSKLRQEQLNLRRFERLGIPTPPIVAWGEEGMWRYRGALVTREIAGALDLQEIASKQPAYFRSRAWVNQVVDQLAECVRRIHEVGFIHFDLKWRNVLVEPEAPKVFLIDCPAGRRAFGPSKEYGILRDLYSLDKSAEGVVTRSARLRFYQRYTRRRKLRWRDKHRLRRLSQYGSRSLLRFLP